MVLWEREKTRKNKNIFKNSTPFTSIDKCWNNRNGCESNLKWVLNSIEMYEIKKKKTTKNRMKRKWKRKKKFETME